MIKLKDGRVPETVRRSPWRQRLIDAETGLRIGIRADSTLFVYFFSAGTVLLFAAAVGLQAMAWAILCLALGISFAFELFHQLCKQLLVEFDEQLTFSARQTLRLGTTAAVAAHSTALIVAVILFWHRLMQ